MLSCGGGMPSDRVLQQIVNLDDRIRCTHEETAAVVKPWEETGSNKSLGCVFSEKPADWTNAFRLEISSLTVLLSAYSHGQVWVENESKGPGRTRDGDVVRGKSDRVRKWNGGRFQGRRKRKKKSFCFVAVQFELIFGHPFFFFFFLSFVHALSSLVRLVISLRRADFWS